MLLVLDAALKSVCNCCQVPVFEDASSAPDDEYGLAFRRAVRYTPRIDRARQQQHISIEASGAIQSIEFMPTGRISGRHSDLKKRLQLCALVFKIG